MCVWVGGWVGGCGCLWLWLYVCACAHLCLCVLLCSAAVMTKFALSQTRYNHFIQSVTIVHCSSAQQFATRGGGEFTAKDQGRGMRRVSSSGLLLLAEDGGGGGGAERSRGLIGTRGGELQVRGGDDVAAAVCARMCL